MRRHAVAVTLIAVAIVCGASPVLASDQSSPGAAVRAGTPAERHARALAFWTPERMRAAIPRELVVHPGGRVEPQAKPNGPGGNGGGKPSRSVNVTGASWTAGGDVLSRTGKVWFGFADGSAWICSGSVAADPSADLSIVLTAAHCAYDASRGGFATSWVFIPEWDSKPAYSCEPGATLYGCWSADALVVHQGWTAAGGFSLGSAPYDFAFAVVRSGGAANTQLDATVGSYPVAIGGLARGERAQAFGYPAGSPYAGNDLTWCAGPVSEDFWTGNATWGMGCDMTGGSSGGPWFEGLSETTGSGGALSSLNSYIYSGSKNMYGPKFNGNTGTVYQAAQAGPTENTVAGG